MVPAHNRPVDRAYVREVKASYEAMRRRARKMPAGIDFAFNPAPAIETDEAERRRLFEERWNYGGLGFIGPLSPPPLDGDANPAAAALPRAQNPHVGKGPPLPQKLHSSLPA